jgi:hypothetical protein
MIGDLDNSEFLQHLYPNGVDLTGEISAILFSWDGPSVQVTIHLDTFPEMPPKKWDSNYNKVSLDIQFIDISDIKMTQFGRFNRATIECSGVKGSYHLIIKGDDCDFQFQAKWLNLKSVNPYMRG